MKQMNDSDLIETPTTFKVRGENHSASRLNIKKNPKRIDLQSLVLIQDTEESREAV
jgi:hypothetical protein